MPTRQTNRMNKSGFGWRGASLLAMLALVSTVAHAQEPSVSKNSGLRVFLVGTSATGHSKALHDIAEGHGHTAAKTKHALMGGAGLGWLMTYMKPENKNDLATNKWDALSLQVTSPMSACMQYGAGFKKGGGFAQLAYEGNPECQIYLFGGGLHPRFPTSMPTNWGVQDRLTRILEQGEAKGLSYQGRVEAIADEFTALFPHRKPCLIIPMEEVLVELHKRILKGEVPEYNHVFDMHDGHWNKHGRYVFSVTFFATIYKQDPHNSVTEDLLYYGAKRYGVTKEFAEVVWDVAWDVITSYRYSGVNPGGPLILGKPRLKTALMGSAYSAFIPATAGSGKFRWALTSGTLPPGLKLNSATGEISGLPEKEGAFKFGIVVSDRDPARTETDKCEYELDIRMPGAPQIATDKLPTAYVGMEYYSKIEADGGYGNVAFGLEGGELPSGLELNSKTGQITGVPTMAGTRQLKLSLRDEKGRHASKQVALDVSEKHLHGVKCEVYELLLQSADDLHGASDEVKYLCYERGVTKNFTTEIVDDPLERPFALRLLSNIKIDKPGAYTFHVEACSAAVLDINGKRVVDKDFFDHGKVIEENGRKRKTVSARCGTITLDAGVHPIEVIMYRRAMNQPRYLEWSFFWSGPGFEKQPIPDNVLMLELE